jgi:hypothetical protein
MLPSGRFSWCALALGLALLAGARPAAADDGPVSADAPPPKADAVDAGDLWHRIHHRPDEDPAAEPPPARRFFVVAPSVGSKPSTGLTIGLSGNVAFFAGETPGTHISSLVGGFKLSQKGQTTAGAKLATFTPGDRWFFASDTRIQLTSLNTYPLGADALKVAGENVKYDYLRLYDTAYRRLRPGLFVGGGLNVSRHTSVRAASGGALATPYAAYSDRNGFAPSGQTSSGASVGFMLDTRDNAINASHGYLASATYRTFFEGFLGGSSTWQELSLDARAYRPLSADGRRTLAAWVLADTVTGGTAPYLDLPTTGGDNYGRLARGYGEGRYRGADLLYGEIEYRQTVTRNGLLGFVTFLNTTTIGGAGSSTHLFESVAPGAGLGLRVLLNKVSRTNLCADYAWGKQGSRGFYLAIQEAF